MQGLLSLAALPTVAFVHGMLREGGLPDAADPVHDHDGWPLAITQKRGKQVFEAGTCAMCHTIQGSQARARFGPKAGQEVTVPKKKVLKFRVAKAAKDAILGAKKYESEAAMRTSVSSMFSYSPYDCSTGGMPVRGKLRKITERYDLSPVRRPCQNGELVESASTCGSR